jgi:hypothetical protein
MPQTPFLSAHEKSETLLAIAFKVPMPVMTIRFFKPNPCIKFIDFLKLKWMPVKCQTDIAINQINYIFYIDNQEQLPVKITTDGIVINNLISGQDLCLMTALLILPQSSLLPVFQ